MRHMPPTARPHPRRDTRSRLVVRTFKVYTTPLESQDAGFQTRTVKLSRRCDRGWWEDTVYDGGSSAGGRRWWRLLDTGARGLRDIATVELSVLPGIGDFVDWATAAPPGRTMSGAQALQ